MIFPYVSCVLIGYSDDDVIEEFLQASTFGLDDEPGDVPALFRAVLSGRGDVVSMLLASPKYRERADDGMLLTERRVSFFRSKFVYTP